MSKVFKSIIFLVVVILIIAWIFIVRAKEKELLKSVEGKKIFFYGIGCPHCANVEKFFEENKVEEKFQFEKKEIYQDKNNAKILILIAKKRCSLPDDQIGVPFFWTGEKCIVGDQPIIDYFREKLTKL